MVIIGNGLQHGIKDITMLAMAREREPAERPKASMITLRLDDPRLGEVLTAYAKQQRRSRQQAILIILEDAMKEAGLWPPEPE